MALFQSIIDYGIWYPCLCSVYIIYVCDNDATGGERLRKKLSLEVFSWRRHYFWLKMDQGLFYKLTTVYRSYKYLRCVKKRIPSMLRYNIFYRKLWTFVIKNCILIILFYYKLERIIQFSLLRTILRVPAYAW